MKISIVTTALNAEGTIADSIKSVLRQTHHDIEHIVIDGKSTDATMDIVNRYRDRISRIISEPDQGPYDAMNKGLRLATGEIVGLLHADDFFAVDNAVEKIAKAFEERDIDCLWGDLVYVNRTDPGRVLRYWRSSSYSEGLIKKGWMPPHPTFFVKRGVYEKYGFFNTDFKFAADYDLILRFLHKHRISGHHIPEVLVRMRAGGLTNRSIINIIKKSLEDYKALKANKLNGRIRLLMRKNISKIPQFFMR